MLPEYIFYGMSPEEFWNGDPKLATAYRKAHYLQIERRNQELWLQGLYVHNAFGVVMSNAFAKKGSKKQKYMERPLDILPPTQKEIKKKRKQEREKLINALDAWANSWKSTH